MLKKSLLICFKISIKWDLTKPHVTKTEIYQILIRDLSVSKTYSQINLTAYHQLVTTIMGKIFI